ncbi:MAG: Abi family protein [Raoultibacter sp.]
MTFGSSPLCFGFGSYPIEFDNPGALGMIVHDSSGDTSQRCAKAPDYSFLGGFQPKIPPKPFLEYRELVAHLAEKGVYVGDESTARAVLARVGYYHLNAYLPAVNKVMGSSVSLAALYNAYVFDMMVQSILFEYISYFEMAFRTQVAHGLAYQFGEFAHLVKEAFKNNAEHQEMVRRYRIERDRKQRAGASFVVHNMQKYGELPVWAAVELMPLGMLSKVFKNMAAGRARDSVCDFFGFDSRILTSWVHSLSFVRNECAHQGILYGRAIPKPPMRQKVLGGIDNRTTFCQFAVLSSLFKKGMRDLNIPMICALRRAIELPPFPLAWLLGFEDGRPGDEMPPWVKKLCGCAGIDANITSKYRDGG